MNSRLLIAALVLAATLGAPAPVRADRPNIVVILADDMGYGDVGAYNDASKIPTPNLDRLAAEGIRLTDAHSPSAVCTPTRYGVLTGRYAWRCGLKSGVLMGYDRPLIEPDRVTVASFLKGHGYTTACVGKWHLGLGWATKPGGEPPRGNKGRDVDYTKPFTGGPLALGFDRFFGISASLDMAPYCWLDQDRVTEIPSDRIAASGGPAYWRAGAISSDFTHESTLPRIALEATRFIDHAAADDDTPFFLYVPLTAPHTPHLPIGRFQGRSEAGVYGDFVHQVDFAIGLIRRSLLNNGVLDDTLFIVTSDNGAHWPPARIEKFGHHANGSWRGQKADIWEGGHRVPFLARWPGRIAPGAVSDQRACLTDLLATVADVVDEPLPRDAGEDSMSVLPALLGETPSGPVRDVTVHHSINGTFALRSGGWKLIDRLGSGGFSKPRTVTPEPDGPTGQLYDLDRDPGETTNLWQERPDVVARLSRQLARALASQPSRPSRPSNVLVLFADDQRYDTIAALGNPAIRTPNLDRLASRGVAFTNAYILGAHHGAVCCPSRAMLMTGRHFHHLPLSVTKLWSVPRDEKGQCPYPIFPELLRERGYQTFGTGKWHNGRALYARAFTGGGAVMFGGMSNHLKVPVFDFDPAGVYPGKPAHPETFSSELFSDAAIDFLKMRDRAKPFLLYVSYTAPHDPRMAPDEYASMYDPSTIAVPPNYLDEHPFPIGDLRVRDEKLAPFPRTPQIAREHIAAYYAMITHMDAQIGRVLETLTTTGAADDTIVIFAGDNGLAVGQHGLLGKQSVYEHSVKVPMIIAGPGVPAGRRSDAFVYVHDLCPTICDMTGVPVPDSVETRSLRPLLTGEAERVRDSVFTTYSTGGPQKGLDGVEHGRGSMRAVRQGRWKLIRSTFAGHDETLLFDLEADPWETRDLSDDPAHASRVADLTALMRRWLAETGDPADLDRSNFGM